jgi:riboflavin kinase/FMN adenylyltransferase
VPLPPQTATLTLEGTVVPGRRRGRTLGYPTANLQLPAGADWPEPGVYAGFALGHPAAVNVGVTPTFEEGREPLVEVHLLDFDGDLYGTTLSVELLERLGPERRYPSREAFLDHMARTMALVRQVAEQRPDDN